MDLVTVQDYRVLTNDITTDDPTVSARIELAVGMVEGALDRWLVLQTYTEKCRVHDNGLVYPHGVPLQSVTSPSGTEPVMGGYAITAGGTNLWWDPVVGPFEVWFIDPFVAVEYVGGYDRQHFPVGLRLIICDLALALASRSPVLTSAAVSSASVGDVSVSYANGGTGTLQVDSILPGISRRLRGFRRPTT